MTETGDVEIESVEPESGAAGPGETERGHVLLIVGRPGVGKTTALRRVAARLEDLRVEGFYTAEVRDESGDRVGFRACSFDVDDPESEGEGTTIASEKIEGEPRVASYGVDVEAIDGISRRHLVPEDADVVIVDEIGKMECHSEVFVDRIRDLLQGDVTTVASVSEGGGGLIEEVKESARTETWEITRGNRDRMPGRISAWVRERAG